MNNTYGHVHLYMYIRLSMALHNRVKLLFLSFMKCSRSLLTTNVEIGDVKRQTCKQVTQQTTDLDLVTKQTTDLEFMKKQTNHRVGDAADNIFWLVDAGDNQFWVHEEANDRLWVGDAADDRIWLGDTGDNRFWVHEEANDRLSWWRSRRQNLVVDTANDRKVHHFCHELMKYYCRFQLY